MAWRLAEGGRRVVFVLVPLRPVPVTLHRSKNEPVVFLELLPAAHAIEGVSDVDAMLVHLVGLLLDGRGAFFRPLGLEVVNGTIG